MDKKQLLIKLKKDIEKIEKTINNYEFHNFKVSILKGLIKTGIGANYILPVIQSGLTIYYIFSSCGCDPFSYDEKDVFKKIYTTTTSTGIELTQSTYEEDVPINNNLFYTTAWDLNDNNLYERVVTEYNINLSDIDVNEIFNFSKEELDNLYEISNIITYQKDVLNEDEQIYDENMIVYQKATESTDDAKKIKQTSDQNILEMLNYMTFSVFGSLFLYKMIYKRLIKKIKYADLDFNYISTNSIHEMTKVLELKKQNYDFLSKE